MKSFSFIISISWENWNKGTVQKGCSLLIQDHYIDKVYVEKVQFLNFEIQIFSFE